MEGTISVGGTTYVWEIDVEEESGPARARFLRCNSKLLGTVNDHREHGSLEFAGWYGERVGSPSTIGPVRDVEAMVRIMIVQYKEIAHWRGHELDAYASDPHASTFDVFKAGTNDRFGRVVRVSEGVWRAYEIDKPSDEPQRAESLKQALGMLERMI